MKTEKVKNWLVEKKDKFKENAEDLACMALDFRERHPFAYGFVLGQSLIYWSLVIHGFTHPKEQLTWVKKK